MTTTTTLRKFTQAETDDIAEDAYNLVLMAHEAEPWTHEIAALAEKVEAAVRDALRDHTEQED